MALEEILCHFLHGMLPWSGDFPKPRNLQDLTPYTYIHREGVNDVSFFFFCFRYVSIYIRSLSAPLKLFQDPVKRHKTLEYQGFQTGLCFKPISHHAFGTIVLLATRKHFVGTFINITFSMLTTQCFVTKFYRFKLKKELLSNYYL